MKLLIPAAISVLALFCALPAAATNSAEKENSAKAVTSAENGGGNVTLRIGDRAPEFKVMAWLKGRPVAHLESGQVFFVEFWATRCGPCIKAMPHLKALAQQYSGRATFISVGLPNEWETEQAMQKFVDKQGDLMNYPVAMDFQDRRLLRAWAFAAGIPGYPTAFIIDRAGKVAWFGNPASDQEQMDAALEQVVKGSYDMAAARARQEAQYESDAADQMRIARRNKELKVLQEALNRKDYPAVVTEADRLIAQDPAYEVEVYASKLRALLNINEHEALIYVQSVYTRLPESNKRTVLYQLTDEKLTLSKSIYEFAAAGLEKKLEKDPKSIKLWERLAQTYYRLGHLNRATEALEKAIALADERGYERESVEMQKRLQTYRHN